MRVIKKAGSGSIFRFLAGSGSIKIEFGSETLLGDFADYGTSLRPLQKKQMAPKF